MIRRRNQHAMLLFCSILPRKTDHDLLCPLTFGLNFDIQLWFAKLGGRRIFVPIHKQLLKFGVE